MKLIRISLICLSILFSIYLIHLEAYLKFRKVNALVIKQEKAYALGELVTPFRANSLF